MGKDSTHFFLAELGQTDVNGFVRVERNPDFCDVTFLDSIQIILLLIHIQIQQSGQVLPAFGSKEMK